nr:hypothetical protein CFP56_42759 [Quercus suber]
MQLTESHPRAPEINSIFELPKSTTPRQDTTTLVETQNLPSIAPVPHNQKSHLAANAAPSRNTEPLVGLKIGTWRRLGPPAHAMDTSEKIGQVFGPKHGRTYICLDRALATIAWKSLFQNTVVQHVPTTASDHSMLVVILSSIRCRRPKFHAPFHFEAMWLRDPHCAEVIQDAWMEGLYKTEGTQITNCLDSCRDRLTSWNKLEFGHVGRQIARLEQELQALDHQPQQNLERIQEVRKALDCWLDIENTMWHQRAKQMWITDGDQNTSFFHQKASNRKQKNYIEGLTDE